jgi:hypothetical protein
MDARQGKVAITRTLTAETTFEDFESISVVDAGAADGFQVKCGDYKGVVSEWITIPTGVPYNIGVASNRYITTLSIKAASGASLNASVTIIY